MIKDSCCFWSRIYSTGTCSPSEGKLETKSTRLRWIITAVVLTQADLMLLSANLTCACTFIAPVLAVSHRRAAGVRGTNGEVLAQAGTGTGKPGLNPINLHVLALMGENSSDKGFGLAKHRLWAQERSGHSVSALP
jgi:hypothetical protein